MSYKTLLVNLSCDHPNSLLRREYENFPYFETTFRIESTSIERANGEEFMNSSLINFIPVPKTSKCFKADNTSLSLILSFRLLLLFYRTTSFTEMSPPFNYFDF